MPFRIEEFRIVRGSIRVFALAKDALYREMKSLSY
jgi:hypothetical protein